jgi:hypothetical protein
MAALLQFLLVEHGFAQAFRIKTPRRPRSFEFALLRRPLQILSRSRAIVDALPRKPPVAR